MKRIIRILRFSPFTKFLFKMKFTDYWIRRLFLNKVTENIYSKTIFNWKEVNSTLNPILEKFNCFLGHGAALSLIRDGEIKYGQDLDYDIFFRENYEDFITEMKNIGMKLEVIGMNNNVMKMFTFSYKGTYIDFFVISNNASFGWNMETCSYEKVFNHFKKYDESYAITKKAVSYLRKLSEKPIIVKKRIQDELIFLPKNYEQYFVDLYGEDWKIPKRYFNWAINEKNNKPILLKNNILIYATNERIKKLFS